MKYHTPDERWSIFGVESFEAYCDQFVITGKFHACVPEDVTDDFLVAEHILAQAYYHYPVYDEAASKVSRIIEMAVKSRCQQLGIPLDYFNTQRSRTEKKVLKKLMDELVAAEPAKNLTQRFEIARMLRNSLMHPDRHHFSGAVSHSYVKHCVTLLNTLFLPATHFTCYKEELYNTPQNSDHGLS